MCLNVIMEIYQQVELLQVEIVGILCVFLQFLFREDLRVWREEKEPPD